MNIWEFILELVKLIIFIAGLFMIFSKTYFSEKGKNLATKEDIEAITNKAEEVQKKFKEDFEVYSLHLKSKYDYYYKSYIELYKYIYPIILQSEYVREFIIKCNNKNTNIDIADKSKYPFLEIGPVVKTTNTYSVYGESSKTTKTETDVTKFNKKAIYVKIIDKAEFSSQELLEVAIKYRFVHENYMTAETNKELFQEEELRLLKEMLKYILRDYEEIKTYLKLF